jgi:hypothetical protein
MPTDPARAVAERLAAEIVLECDRVIRSDALDDLEYCQRIVADALAAYAAEQVRELETLLREARGLIRHNAFDQRRCLACQITKRLDAALRGRGGKGEA